jgi:branched-chain amino acid transport system permease protein
MNRLMSSRYAALFFVALVVIVPGVLLNSSFYLRVGALIFIFGFAALGLNLLMGYAGQVSLGHAGFIGIGAYATAVLPTHFGWNIFAAMAAGIAGAGLIAYIVGGPILRLKGHYLAVATLALGILISMVISNEVKYTGGPDGMAVPRLEVFGFRLRTAQHWYWISGGVLFLGIIAAQNLIESPTGRALRALHDSEVAAGTLGIDASQYKLIVFVVSAVYAAIAGVCFALLNGHITPDSASFLRSVELVTMVVIGGMGSILGALVGAALLGLLEQWLAQFHEVETLILGLVMMAVMIFMRDGIVPTLQRLLASRRSS